MGFALDGILEGMAGIFKVALAYAVMNEAMQNMLLPLIDETKYPSLAPFKETYTWYWNNWGLWAIIAFSLYMIARSINKTDRLEDLGYYQG